MAANKNFNLKRAADFLDEIMVDAVNRLGSHLNRNIQDGLDNSTDINGNAFKPLSPVTIANRSQSNPKPLLDKGTNKTATNALRTVKKKLATPASPVFVLESKSDYGGLHNTGYTNSKGVTVEKREWFGITKDIKPGGEQYKKAILEATLRIGAKFKAGG